MLQEWQCEICGKTLTEDCPEDAEDAVAMTCGPACAAKFRALEPPGGWGAPAAEVPGRKPRVVCGIFQQLRGPKGKAVAGWVECSGCHHWTPEESAGAPHLVWPP